MVNFFVQGNLAESSLEKGEHKPVLHAMPGKSEIKIKVNFKLFKELVLVET